MDRGAWLATVHWISESDTTEQLTHYNIYKDMLGSMDAMKMTTCSNFNITHGHSKRPF